MELNKIRGINEKREQDLNKLGIFNTADLMQFFPRAYLDLRTKQSLAFSYHNDIVLTNGKIISEPQIRYYKKGGLVKVICEQDGLVFSVTWYNQPYVANKLKVGEEYLFYGRVRREDGVVGLTNPSFELCDKVFRLKGIVPQYSLKGNLTQKVVRDAVRLAVDIEKPQSIIPLYLQKKYALCDLFWAYREVHNPTDMLAQRKASERIAIEEYFALISAFKFVKGGRESVRNNRYSLTKSQIEEFIKERFNFEFTAGQLNAVSEIFNDMNSPAVMNRLVQGDVGSGKTAVSMCAAFIACKSGYQVVMLAPTEVLAMQNYKVFKKVFKDFNVALLTGSMTAKQKRSVKASLESGLTQILVGTHAVLTEDVVFKNLSLCICDEQQRFGVAQRSALLNKGNYPDVLVMSATPIPRTLSLIIYGDLDITTILDKPKTRISIQTNIVSMDRYADMLEYIRSEIKSGGQAYFVCPRVEGDDEGTIMSALELYEQISERLDDISVGLLHGKMKDKEKEAVMQDFEDGKIGLLISTTVIEVGVDVPNATIMVIYNAERFGLSQLHQLRGRVGRSDKKSYCFLTTASSQANSIERLKIIKDNSDGFKIAEYDYKLRGGGDFMGSRQSGKSMHDLGNLNYSTDSIYLAKKISDEVFERGENMQIIKQVVYKKYDKLKDIALN